MYFACNHDMTLSPSPLCYEYTWPSSCWGSPCPWPPARRSSGCPSYWPGTRPSGTGPCRGHLEIQTPWHGHNHFTLLILADEEAICSLLLCMKLRREPYWANSMISKIGPGNKHFNRFIEVSILYQRECISLTYSHTTNFPKLYFIMLQIAPSSHFKIPEFLKPN